MYDLVLKSCKMFYNDKLICCDVGIDSGKIVALGKNLKGEQTISCKGKFVFPGLIDVHVHFRVPGQSYKEDWKHASKAALASGITTVFDMPNNKPPICNKDVLMFKQKLVSKEASVDYALYLAVSPKVEELDKKALNEAIGLKLYMASTTEAILVDDIKSMRLALKKAAETGKVVAVHAEDNKTINRNVALAKKAKTYSLAKHHLIRSSKAEAIAVEKIVNLAKEVGASVHICHLSSEAGVDIIKEAKKEGGKISCGVTPHHLFLTNEDVKKLGNFAKVNPSIKTKKDRKALRLALNAGLIDIIESDHAPHTFEEKELSYEEAPSGIANIEALLPMLLDAYNRKLLSLETILNCCCKNPAMRFGLKYKGNITIGNDADFCIVDLKREYKFSEDCIYSKCGWNIFEGRKLKGYVEKTLVRGTLCYDSGDFPEKIKGENLLLK